MKNWINKFIISILFISAFSSCQSQTSNKQTKSQDTISVSIASDSLFINNLSKLDTLKKLKSLIGNFDFKIKDTPTKENPYYIIQAGKSNNYRWEVFYNFYCYPTSGIIKLYDPVQDTLITMHQNR